MTSSDSWSYITAGYKTSKVPFYSTRKPCVPEYSYKMADTLTGFISITYLTKLDMEWEVNVLLCQAPEI